MKNEVGNGVISTSGFLTVAKRPREWNWNTIKGLRKRYWVSVGFNGVRNQESEQISISAHAGMF